MSGGRSPLDQAVDLFLYVPVGLAVTVHEHLAEVVERGRRRVTEQVSTARAIGQLVVSQGEKEARKLVDRAGAAFSGASAGRAQGAGEGPTGGPRRDGGARPGEQDAPPAASPPVGGAVATAATNGQPGTPARSGAHLAIPGYDALSASQVVQRLAGLTPEELAAVEAYETSTRGRRTILSRVAQLRADQ